MEDADHPFHEKEQHYIKNKKLIIDALVLMFISSLILMDGIIRTTILVQQVENTDIDWDTDDPIMPPVATLIGSLLEVVYGLAGLLVGAATVFSDSVSGLAMLIAVFAMMFSIYTWVVNIIAAPARFADQIDNPPYDISIDRFRTLVAWGIVGEAGYTAILFYGQSFIAIRLYARHSNISWIFNNIVDQMARIIFSLVLIAIGASGLIVGSLLIDEFDKELEVPFIVFPWIVHWTPIPVAIGCILIVIGSVGLIRQLIPARLFQGTTLRSNITKLHNYCHMLVWLTAYISQLALMIPTQISFFERPTILVASGISSVSPGQLYALITGPLIMMLYLGAPKGGIGQVTHQPVAAEQASDPEQPPEVTQEQVVEA